MAIEAKEMAVYAKYQAESVKGKYDKKRKTTIRKNVKMLAESAEEANEQFDHTGVWYVENKTETKKLQADIAERAKAAE